MKKWLMIPITVLVLVGLLGSVDQVFPQAFPFVTDWIGSRPEAVEAWYNHRVFESRANKLMDCIADRLIYTRAIGVAESADDTLVVMLHILPENLRDTGDWDSLANQFQVFIACSRYVPGWTRLSIVGHTFNELAGFSSDGKITVIYKPLVNIVVRIKKEEATLLLQAEKPGEFFDGHILDGSIEVTFLGFYNVPQVLPLMDGSRVVEAIYRSNLWNQDRAEIIEIMKQEAVEAKETQVPPAPTEPPTLK